ncbi:MAG: acylneuraminate cytidylyltransferase family protein [Cypionkella sp.]|nr:acylneuraminate cytidylyltransferase family protein [Cypionkella sp.]
MTHAAPSVLAVITARGGSKDLPGKNIRHLAGRPLIAWSIEAALGASCISRVIVSTDAPEIAEAALAAGAEVPFLRPADLATDGAGSADVVAHALGQCPGHDVFVLLQPTSPLRNADDLDQAFGRMQAAGADGCVSVSEAEQSPWLMYVTDGPGLLNSLLPPWPGGMRRQDLPPVYLLNGAFYFMRTDVFLRDRKFVTPRCIGHQLPQSRAVDIDTLADFERAEARLATMHQGAAQ